MTLRTASIAVGLCLCLVISGVVAFLLGNVVDFDMTHDRTDPIDRTMLVTLAAGVVAFLAAWRLGRLSSGSYRRAIVGLLPIHACMAGTGAVANHLDFGLAVAGGMVVSIPVGLSFAGFLSRPGTAG